MIQLNIIKNLKKKYFNKLKILMKFQIFSRETSKEKWNLMKNFVKWDLKFHKVQPGVLKYK